MSFLKRAVIAAYNNALLDELDGSPPLSHVTIADIADVLLTMVTLDWASHPVDYVTLMEQDGEGSSSYAFRAGWLGRRAYLLITGEERRVCWTTAGNGTSVYELALPREGSEDMGNERCFMDFIVKSVRAAFAAEVQ